MKAPEKPRPRLVAALYRYATLDSALALGPAPIGFAQGEEFAAITPQRLQIPPVTAISVVKVKIIRDLDKKPTTDVREVSVAEQGSMYQFDHFVTDGLNSSSSGSQPCSTQAVVSFGT